MIIRLVEANQFDEKMTVNRSISDDFKNIEIDNESLAINNSKDDRIVDELILSIQGETSFEFSSIQSEASILSIEVISIYIVLLKKIL